MKVAILGYSGSGKSTLAKAFGDSFQIPVLYLDTVQFLPDWQERDRDEARAMVARFLERQSWVIDGNYGAFYQQDRLEQADLIVLLLFPRIHCLIRVCRRWMRFRNMPRESRANGCIEKVDGEFVWWILHKGRTKEKRNQYREIARQYPEKTIVVRGQWKLDRLTKIVRRGEARVFQQI